MAGGLVILKNRILQASPTQTKVKFHTPGKTLPVKFPTFRTQKILFLTSEPANKAEIYILSARDTTKAWVPGRGVMGNDIRVYKTKYPRGCI